MGDILGLTFKHTYMEQKLRGLRAKSEPGRFRVPDERFKCK